MRINAILMAAGNSHRFGSNKLIHVIDGKPMFQHILEKVLAVESGLFQHIIVVTQYQEIMRMAEKFDKALLLVENDNSNAGISYSIQLGMEADAADAYAFFVCDQPKLKSKTIEGFIKGFQNSGKTIGCVTCKGRLGNPVVFMSCYYQELLNLNGDAGGKSVMKSHMEEVFFFEVEDERELYDMDEVK